MLMLSIDAQYCVDGEIKARDSWLTMLAGVLIMRDGLDEVVRWIEMPVPLSFFGLVPGRYVETAILLAQAPSTSRPAG
jgi:hypothetical protein